MYVFIMYHILSTIFTCRKYVFIQMRINFKREKAAKKTRVNTMSFFLLLLQNCCSTLSHRSIFAAKKNCFSQKNCLHKREQIFVCQKILSKAVTTKFVFTRSIQSGWVHYSPIRDVCAVKKRVWCEIEQM